MTWRGADELTEKRRKCCSCQIDRRLRASLVSKSHRETRLMDRSKEEQREMHGYGESARAEGRRANKTMSTVNGTLGSGCEYRRASRFIRSRLGSRMVEEVRLPVQLCAKAGCPSKNRRTAHGAVRRFFGGAGVILLAETSAANKQDVLWRWNRGVRVERTPSGVTGFGINCHRR